VTDKRKFKKKTRSCSRLKKKHHRRGNDGNVRPSPYTKRKPAGQEGGKEAGEKVASGFELSSGRKSKPRRTLPTKIGINAETGRTEAGQNRRVETRHPKG